MAPEDEPGRADPVGGPAGNRPAVAAVAAVAATPSEPSADAVTPARPGPPTQLADRPLDQPRADRLPVERAAADAILAAHRAAMEGGQGGYLDPVTGLYVLTASYLAARGVCCETGCRHCPYLVVPDEGGEPGPQR